MPLRVKKDEQISVDEFLNFVAKKLLVARREKLCVRTRDFGVCILCLSYGSFE